MYLIFYQILILFCLIQLSLLDRGERRNDRPRPRRVLENLQENLGRIHEALHELGSELPADNQRGFRNRPRGQRFGRSFNWFNRGPLFPPHPFNPLPPPPPFNPFFRPGGFDRPFDRPGWGPRWGPRWGGPGRPGRPFRRRRPHPMNDQNNPNSYEYETTPYDYPDDYQTPPPSPQDSSINNNHNNHNNNNRNDNNHNNNNYNADNRDTRPTSVNVIHTTPKPYPSNNAPTNNNRNTGTRKPNTTPAYNNDQSNNDKSKSLTSAEKICGLRSDARIVGGKETTKNSWTWMAALIKNDGTNYCGGVLLTSQHVLTAAHCLKSQTPKDMFVRLGEYDFNDESSATSEDHEVEYFIIHSNYDKFTHVNDIAILRLKEPAAFTHFIRPVCLPGKRKDYTNEIATVVGYGAVAENKPTSARLREVSVPIWKHEQCEEAYGTNMTQGQMCAGFREGGKDSCQGDSGGPLMIQVKQKWQVVGIVSFGIGCGQRYPGVYTRVNKYLDWIISNLN